MRPLQAGVHRCSDSQDGRTHQPRVGSEHVGHTVLRTYCGIFSLTNPNFTWSFYSEEASPTFFDIDLLPAGSTVTLLVEPPDTVKEEDEELNEEY